MRQWIWRAPFLNDSRDLRDPAFRDFPDTIAACRRLLRAAREDPSRELLVWAADGEPDEATGDEAFEAADEDRKACVEQVIRRDFPAASEPARSDDEAAAATPDQAPRPDTERVPPAEDGRDDGDDTSPSTSDESPSADEEGVLAAAGLYPLSMRGAYALHLIPGPGLTFDGGRTAAEALMDHLLSRHEILQLMLTLPREPGSAWDGMIEGLSARGFRMVPSGLDDHPVLAAAVGAASASDSRPDNSASPVLHYQRMVWDRDEDGPEQLGFVPSRTGIIMVRTDRRAVREVTFLEYGATPDDPWIMNQAWRQGLTDDAGCLYTRRALLDQHYNLEAQIAHRPRLLAEALRQIDEYVRGKRRIFTLPYATREGTPFQRHVWRVLETIPYGSTRHYEEIGEAVARLEAQSGEAPSDMDHDALRGQNLAKAVGAACKANPLPILLPCHRVIGKNGRILGYSGDPKHKSWLLWEEQVTASRHD